MEEKEEDTISLGSEEIAEGVYPSEGVDMEKYPHLVEKERRKTPLFTTRKIVVDRYEHMYESGNDLWYLGNCGLIRDWTPAAIEAKIEESLRIHRELYIRKYLSIVYSYDFFNEWIHTPSGTAYLNRKLIPYCNRQITAGMFTTGTKTLLFSTALVGTICTLGAASEITLPAMAATMPGAIAAAASLVGHADVGTQTLEMMYNKIYTYNGKEPYLHDYIAFYTWIRDRFTELDRLPVPNSEKCILKLPYLRLLYYCHEEKDYMTGFLMWKQHLANRIYNHEIFITNNIMIENGIRNLYRNMTETRRQPDDTYYTISIKQFKPIFFMDKTSITSMRAAKTQFNALMRGVTVVTTSFGGNVLKTKKKKMKKKTKKKIEKFIQYKY